MKPELGAVFVSAQFCNCENAIAYGIVRNTIVIISQKVLPLHKYQCKLKFASAQKLHEFQFVRSVTLLDTAIYAVRKYFN